MNTTSLEKVKMKKMVKRELNNLDDFAINDLVSLWVLDEDNKKGHREVVPVWVFGEALAVWQERHPGSLPPCFAEVEKSLYHFGPSFIYEWPQA